MDEIPISLLADMAICAQDSGTLKVTDEGDGNMKASGTFVIKDE